MIPQVVNTPKKDEKARKRNGTKLSGNTLKISARSLDLSRFKELSIEQVDTVPRIGNGLTR